MGRLTNWEKQVNRSQQAGIARKTNQAMRKAPDESGGLMCYLAVVASDVNKTACATTLYLLCLWQRRGRSPTRALNCPGSYLLATLDEMVASASD